MNKIFSIAIDGPAGAGKSTVAKAVAKQLGAVYLDTGAMYRTMGLYMQQNKISGNDSISKACGKPELGIRFIGDDQHMILDGVDVTGLIRSSEASKLASRVSAVAAVRERLVDLQREFAKGNSVVMDGRDIGTHVLPDATLKIFLTASCEVRAQRRHREMLAKGGEQAHRVYSGRHRGARFRRLQPRRVPHASGGGRHPRGYLQYDSGSGYCAHRRACGKGHPGGVMYEYQVL